MTTRNLTPTFRFGGLNLRLEWKLADLWIGLYFHAGAPVKSYRAGTLEYRHDRPVDAWVCVLPCLPLHFWWTAPAKAPSESPAHAE